MWLETVSTFHTVILRVIFLFKLDTLIFKDYPLIFPLHKLLFTGLNISVPQCTLSQGSATQLYFL